VHMAAGHSARTEPRYAEPIDGGRLRVLIDHARQLYDWVILDLPTRFQPDQPDGDCRVRTGFSGLHGRAAHLHLTRKAMTMIDHLLFRGTAFRCWSTGWISEMTRKLEFGKMFNCRCMRAC